jgi:hypothetical protein
MFVQVRFLTAPTKKVRMAGLVVGRSASQASTSPWTAGGGGPSARELGASEEFDGLGDFLLGAVHGTGVGLLSVDTLLMRRRWC